MVYKHILDEETAEVEVHSIAKLGWVRAAVGLGLVEDKPGLVIGLGELHGVRHNGLVCLDEGGGLFCKFVFVYPTSVVGFDIGPFWLKLVAEVPQKLSLHRLVESFTQTLSESLDFCV